MNGGVKMARVQVVYEYHSKSPGEGPLKCYIENNDQWEETSAYELSKKFADVLNDVDATKCSNNGPIHKEGDPSWNQIALSIYYYRKHVNDCGDKVVTLLNCVFLNPHDSQSGKYREVRWNTKNPQHWESSGGVEKAMETNPSKWRHRRGVVVGGIASVAVALMFLIYTKSR